MISPTTEFTHLCQCCCHGKLMVTSKAFAPEQSVSFRDPGIFQRFHLYQSHFHQKKTKAKPHKQNMLRVETTSDPLDLLNI